MQATISILLMLLGVALVSSVSFVAVASSLSRKTVGRPLYISTIVLWIFGALLVQAVLAAWLFHPLTYIIVTGMVCIAEWIAIAVPKGREAAEIEPPGTRFLAWLLFGLGPIASMVIAAASRTDGWAFSGKAIPLYGLPLVAVLVIGLLRIALCGPVPTAGDEKDDEEELDEQPEEELEELDEEDEEVEIIDGTELDEDELEELEELEIEDCDIGEDVA